MSNAALDRVTKTCKEIVFGERVRSWQCHRKAGYGQNGDYCKQHALKHADDKAEIPLWDLEIVYGDGIPKPIKAREVTPSTYVDANGCRLKRRTEYHVIFDSREEAIKHALKRAEAQLKSAERDVLERGRLVNKLKGKL